ncbi:peptidoglycan-binding protein [Agromyces sp. S2-1-8]|uniref:peptidoglycan-binding protein n=1 Tax=Agromyces sp. S2-1-8 TaxID=2897180 RepID=UPI001E3F909D|nr:peptidoglycan-binding protein [Agromyces sp. S2-1-8]MCD5345880.1 peptidoglycan-binding protein [Agromyces sp. S2-1-8]
MSTRARLGWIGLGLLAVAGVGVTAAAASGFGFAPAAATPAPAAPETGEVTRGDLIATTTESGELANAGETVLRADGGTLTWLPAAGAVVERGGQLYRVDDAPVVLLVGAMPAYRVLAPGTSGADVRQFEENLAALGYTGFDVDDDYTWATADAVEDWQEALGVDETGTVEPSRIHYAGGSVQVTSVAAAVGDAAAGEVLTTASTDRVVQVDLDETDAAYAVVGAVVEVALPDGTTFPATVTSVETVVIPGEDPPMGNGDTTALRVTATPDDPAAVGAAGGSTAEVAFTAETREGVLSVPVTALLALAEGGYAVEVVRGDGTELVGVETGLFADGRVEVAGAGIAEGDTVVVAS